MNLASNQRILYLDYDGVLHPDEVYMVYGKIELRARGKLFENADKLADILDLYPDVKIVLSTNWVPSLKNYNRAKSYLPEKLNDKVIGATWHSYMCNNRYEINLWMEQGKYHNITSDVARRRPYAWFAIDDDCPEWPDEQKHHLLLTHPDFGLGSNKAKERLIQKLDLLVHGDELKTDIRSFQPKPNKLV